MTTGTYRVIAGIASKQLCSANANRVALIVITKNLTTSDDIPLIQNVVYIDAYSKSELWIIADADNTDVRVQVVS